MYIKVLYITKKCLSDISPDVASYRSPSRPDTKEISRPDSYLDFMSISHNLLCVGLHLDTFTLVTSFFSLLLPVIIEMKSSIYISDKLKPRY